jgi:quinol monooxygenase YgiN
MTFVVTAHWTSRQGAQDEIAAILRELVGKTREEPGCIEFIAHRSREKPDDFFLYEQYGSEEDWRRHQSTAHFAELVLKRAVPLLARRERFTFDLLA